MAKEDLTPEDKLLKIIENPFARKQKAASSRDRNEGIKRKRWDFGSLWRPQNILELFKFKNFNNILIAVCILATAYFIFDFNYRRTRLKSRLAEIEAGKINIGEEDKLAFLEEPILPEREGRNVFTFFSIKEKEEKKDEASTVDLSQVVNNLRLVGVIWTETNPQAMIENTESQKTFILSAGEQIGEVKIKKIYIDRVIVEIKGKEWVLR